MIYVHHRIWFGSCLPEKYQANLLTFKQFNPAYQIQLWTDFSSLRPEEIEQFGLFCDTHTIGLCDIRDYTSLTNYPLIIEELDRIQTDDQNRRIHAVRASDLARIAILIEQGGVYSDTDTLSKHALPEIDLPLGFKAKLNPFPFVWDDQDQLVDDIPEFDFLLYDFMVATPQNKILKLAAEISVLDYSTYAHSQHRQWESSTHSRIHLLSTIRLTGSSLRWAINYLLAHGEISLNQKSDLIFDTDCMYSTYDKSWLPSSDETLNDEHMKSMLLFRDEIESHRCITFPYHLPSLSQAKPRFDVPYPHFQYELPPFEPITFDLKIRRDELESIDKLFALNDQWTFNKMDLPKIDLPKMELVASKLQPFHYDTTVIAKSLFICHAEFSLRNYIKSNRSMIGLFDAVLKPSISRVKIILQQIDKKELTDPYDLLSQLNAIISALKLESHHSLSSLAATLQTQCDKIGVANNDPEVAP